MMSEIVWKEQNLILCFETPFENCSNCLQIHRNKASLDSIMVYTGMPVRYISIATPDHGECVPISCGSKLIQPLPMEAHAA
jgi:hypothetical protein